MDVEDVCHSAELPIGTETCDDPESSAGQAGLSYVRDSEAGILRRRCGRGFTYLDAHGRRVDDGDVRTRIEELSIPPAWKDVWICSDSKGHIQATGRDADGRKQYIYHPEWERIRHDAKFLRMIAFGRALERLRRYCRKQLRDRPLSREKVLCAVVLLLDGTLARVGSSAHTARNGSFGITTLRDQHVNVSGTRFTFDFSGKGGKRHQIELDDPRLARIVRSCRDVPGHKLFQYYDEHGERRQVESADVNEFLKTVTGESFSAKDFRTWGATVHAAVYLSEVDEPASEAEADRHVVSMVKHVAARLGNTPAVCRQYYVHPHVVEAFRAGAFQDLFRSFLKRTRHGYLRREERALLRFFEAWTPNGDRGPRAADPGETGTTFG